MTESGRNGRVATTEMVAREVHGERMTISVEALRK